MLENFLPILNKFSIPELDAPTVLEPTPKGATPPSTPFPTNHPLVRNNGKLSNVLTATFSFGEGKDKVHVVIPTMVDGKKLTNDEAVAIAKKQGLQKYPTFDTKAKAEAASVRIHEQQEL